jgi:hypothetical protein
VGASLQARGKRKSSGVIALQCCCHRLPVNSGIEAAWQTGLVPAAQTAPQAVAIQKA